MHTSEYTIEGYEDPVRVFRNGDWSGDVIIAFQEKPFGPEDKQKYTLQEVTIPAALLVAVALPATRDMMSRALVSFAERLPRTLGLMAAIEAEEAEDAKEKAEKTKRKGKK